MATTLAPESELRMRRFVEKVHRVRDSRYVEHWTNHGTGIQLHFDRGRGSKTTNFPDIEATEAVVLTLRMFIQPKDYISFVNLGKIREDIGVSDVWKKSYDDEMAKFQRFMEDFSGFNIDSEDYTNRRLMDVFF